MDQILYRIVHLLVFVLVVLKYILQLHRVSQFVISKQVAVAVINIASGTCQLLCFFN